MATNDSLGDIRTLSPEEHWKHFEDSWVALQSYTYLGKGTPFLDVGVDSEIMPLRSDMRNSTGGIMAAPLCIAAPEPFWRDDECVPAYGNGDSINSYACIPTCFFGGAGSA